jgi:predicted transcriptional regulator YheO
VLIRDEHGAPIGALCINYDLTHLQVATSALEELSRINEHDQAGTEETYPRDATTFLHIMIDQALGRLSKPVALLTKKDNLSVVRELEENNIFSIKHAVEAVARRLNVSRYTVYNYIDEVRSERRHSAYHTTREDTGPNRAT